MSLLNSYFLIDSRLQKWSSENCLYHLKVIFTVSELTLVREVFKTMGYSHYTEQS